MNNEIPKAAVLAPISFIDAGEFSVGGFPRAFAMCDFNADGQLDLAMANAQSNDVAVLFNATQ